MGKPTALPSGVRRSSPLPGRDGTVPAARRPPCLPSLLGGAAARGGRQLPHHERPHCSHCLQAPPAHARAGRWQPQDGSPSPQRPGVPPAPGTSVHRTISRSGSGTGLTLANSGTWTQTPMEAQPVTPHGDGTGGTKQGRRTHTYSVPTPANGRGSTLLKPRHGYRTPRAVTRQGPPGQGNPAHPRGDPHPWVPALVTGAMLEGYRRSKWTLQSRKTSPGLVRRRSLECVLLFLFFFPFPLYM